MSLAPSTSSVKASNAVAIIPKTPESCFAAPKTIFDTVSRFNQLALLSSNALVTANNSPGNKSYISTTSLPANLALSIALFSAVWTSGISFIASNMVKYSDVNALYSPLNFST